MNASSFVINVDMTISFLHDMYLNGCRYSGICAARDAIARAVTLTGYEKLSKHPSK